MKTRTIALIGAALMLLLVALVACTPEDACAAPGPAPRPPAPAPRVVAPAAPRPAPAPRVQAPARPAPAPARTVHRTDTHHSTSYVPVWVPYFGGSDDDCD